MFLDVFQLIRLVSENVKTTSSGCFSWWKSKLSSRMSVSSWQMQIKNGCWIWMPRSRWGDKTLTMSHLNALPVQKRSSCKKMTFLAVRASSWLFVFVFKSTERNKYMIVLAPFQLEIWTTSCLDALPAYNVNITKIRCTLHYFCPISISLSCIWTSVSYMCMCVDNRGQVGKTSVGM